MVLQVCQRFHRSVQKLRYGALGLIPAGVWVSLPSFVLERWVSGLLANTLGRTVGLEAITFAGLLVCQAALLSSAFIVSHS